MKKHELLVSFNVEAVIEISEHVNRWEQHTLTLYAILKKMPAEAVKQLVLKHSEDV